MPVVPLPAHPDGAVFLQLVPTGGQPFAVEGVDAFGRSSLVPLAFVDTHHPSALHADAPVGEEIGRVGEYHVELEVKLLQEADAIAMQEGEGAVGGAEVGGNLMGSRKFDAIFSFSVKRNEINANKIRSTEHDTFISVSASYMKIFY